MLAQRTDRNPKTDAAALRLPIRLSDAVAGRHRIDCALSAPHIISKTAHPFAVRTAIQLRYLQTLSEIAVEKNSTILFPIPIEFVKGVADLLAKHTQ